MERRVFLGMMKGSIGDQEASELYEKSIEVLLRLTRFAEFSKLQRGCGSLQRMPVEKLAQLCADELRLFKRRIVAAIGDQAVLHAVHRLRQHFHL